MNIERFSGTDERLYRAVAPLVMNPAVLRQNNNYPFKTSVHFIWFVAFEGEQVAGFVPVEVKNTRAVINNYYVAGEDAGVLSALVAAAAGCLGAEHKLQAVVLTRDEDVFKGLNFDVTKKWKQYVKMEYRLPLQNG